MDTKQINDALDRIFKEEDQRIVFWNDLENEFQNILPYLMLENVSILRLDEVGALAVKIKLEHDDPTGRYLLYSPTEEPNYEDDWLLDIRLYSRGFRADKASVILDELGLRNQHLRQHLADRRKFFDNKDRLQKLKTLVAADDTEIDLDRKMLAVVSKADQPELFNIIRTLFHSYTEDKEDIDLDNPPAVWEQIDKFNLAGSFWEMVKTTFGYSADDPSLKNLLIRLFVTEYSQKLKADLPVALGNLVLPPAGRANTVVFLDQWRDSTSKGSSYDLL